MADNLERLGLDVGRDRGRGAQPRPLRPRRRLPRAGPAAAPQRNAAHGAPTGVESASLCRTRPAEWELPTLSRSVLEAEGFEVIERRQPSLLLDGSRPGHRRGRPHHRVRARAALPRGVARRAVGTRSAGPRRAGARRPRPWTRAGRAHRMRARRSGEHRSARDAAHRCGSTARPARRLSPRRPGLRTHHRTHRGRVHRDGTGLAGTGPLHGLEGPASAWPLHCPPHSCRTPSERPSPWSDPECDPHPMR